MDRVLCVALAPAVQRTFFLEKLALGDVNRAQRVLVTPAGKAVNTASVLVRLGHESAVAGLSGGIMGSLLESQMRERGVLAEFTAMEAETRVCVTLVDGQGCVTELVQEAPVVADAVLGRFRSDVMRLLESGGLSGVCLCGTLPKWVPQNLYVAWLEAASRRGIPVILDTHGAPLYALLERTFRPALLKLNQDEAARTWPGDWQAGARTCGCPVLVTLGAKGAVLVTETQIERFSAPAVKAVNPIGSGDAASAGILAGLIEGQPLADAIVLGMKCGSANAATLTPGDLGRHFKI